MISSLTLLTILLDVLFVKAVFNKLGFKFSFINFHQIYFFKISILLILLVEIK